MRFFPIEYFEIETPLSTEEVKQRLEGLIEAPKSKRSAIELKNARPFEGSIHENTFQMKAIDPNPRAQMPTFMGEIGEVQGKTLVVVNIHGEAGTLKVAWIMLAAIGFLLAFGATRGIVGMLMPLGASFVATIISIAVIYNGLNNGVKRGKKKLEELLLVELF